LAAHDQHRGRAAGTRFSTGLSPDFGDSPYLHIVGTTYEESQTVKY
jgi:hypothetical protein